MTDLKNLQLDVHLPALSVAFIIFRDVTEDMEKWALGKTLTLLRQNP